MEYVKTFYMMHDLLPALGHLHFLFNNLPSSNADWVHEFSERNQENIYVDLDSDLCICDCSMIESKQKTDLNSDWFFDLKSASNLCRTDRTNCYLR